MSYGEVLVWLENNLNPELTNEMSNMEIEIDKYYEGDDQKIDKAKNALLMLDRFHFPVHVCGYNWLKSNMNSADSLSKRVNEIVSGYSQAGMNCEKVILVTHSMGGLVARYYSEVLKGNVNVHGIVHGVMPAIGASAFYRRMKCGTDGGWAGVAGVAGVLGDTAEKMTAVLAFAPGPLELIPTPEYGRGWLKIRSDKQDISLPTGDDPYTEIYLERDNWWGMLDAKLALPEYSDDEKLSRIDDVWISYSDIFLYKVKEFHQNISQTYHCNTYIFYSNSDDFPSYGDLS